MDRGFLGDPRPGCLLVDGGRAGRKRGQASGGAGPCAGRVPGRGPGRRCRRLGPPGDWGRHRAHAPEDRQEGAIGGEAGRRQGPGPALVPGAAPAISGPAHPRAGPAWGKDACTPCEARARGKGRSRAAPVETVAGRGAAGQSASAPAHGSRGRSRPGTPTACRGFPASRSAGARGGSCSESDRGSSCRDGTGHPDAGGPPAPGGCARRGFRRGFAMVARGQRARVGRFARSRGHGGGCLVSTRARRRGRGWPHHGRGNQGCRNRCRRQGGPAGLRGDLAAPVPAAGSEARMAGGGTAEGAGVVPGRGDRGFGGSEFRVQGARPGRSGGRPGVAVHPGRSRRTPRGVGRRGSCAVRSKPLQIRFVLPPTQRGK